MTRGRRLAGVVTVLLAAVAVTVAGCGDDGPHVGTIDGEPREPKPGGQLTHLSVEPIDSLDPGRTYRSVGFMTALAVGRPLFQAPPGDDGRIAPDLADGAPQISEDRMTVRIRIRGNVRYAPPVNRVVRSADVKYAIERAFSRNVANPYADRYLSALVGAPRAGAGPVRSIPGILTPDDRTIVLRLTRPEANLVVQALALPITIPVPREYAARFDAMNPSTYGLRPVSSGPYMFERASDSAELRLTGPLVLIRNPNWDHDSDRRPAYADTITVRSGQANPARAVRETLAGEGILCCGTTTLPGPLLARTLDDNPDQVDLVPDGSTRSIAFNTARAPFDNANLRRAVTAALNRTELRRVAGGENIGTIAQGWLAPGIPGASVAGGVDQNADLDYLANPAGDLAVARRYMDAAAREGLPVRGGEWMADDPIVLVDSGGEPSRAVTDLLRQQLESLGFRVIVREVTPPVDEREVCGASAAQVAVCPMTWAPDLLDPQATLDPQFNGAAVRPASGTNWARLDDPEINASLDRAARHPMGDDRDKAYAAVNHEIAKLAPAAPWLWGQTAVIRSRDTAAVVSRLSGLPDLSYSWVSQP